LPWNDVDPDKIHRLFYPQVPVIVTTQFRERVGAMSAIWCVPLSFKPPLIGVAIAPEHETYKILVEAQAFAVNFVDFRHAKRIGELGETSSKKLRDKLSSVGFTVSKGKSTGQPLIQEAEAALECRVHERHRTGSHELIIGEVTAALAADSFGDYWDFARYNPILYAGTEDSDGKCWVFMSGRGEKVTLPLKLQA
jgi:flavin reductase (DIM6/NTAB) family NADH-FMN oxidoreductase RutF